MKETFFRLLKIDITKPSNEEVSKAINESFNNITTYFRRTIKGNKVYVGKRLNPYLENQLKQKISFIPPTSLGKSTSTRNVLKKHDIGISKNRSIASSLPTIKSYSSSTINLNNSSPDLKYQVSDAELNQLFENIKQKTEKNSTHLNDFVKQFEEPHMKNIIHLQEQSLKNQEEYLKQQKYIENRLSKVTKKTPENLLLNQINKFRIMKEFKASSDNYHSDNQSNLFKWAMNLRSEKKFIGCRKAIINIGSEMKPNWAIIYEKMPKIKETIRYLNTKDSCCHQSLSSTKIISGKHHNYPLDKLKNSFDDLQGLNVKGKSLLQSEIEQIKAISGKKKMMKKIIGDEDTTTKVIASNLSLKNIFDVKIINSCMKIHQV